MTLLTLRLVSSGLYGEKPSGEGALRGGVTRPLGTGEALRLRRPGESGFPAVFVEDDDEEEEAAEKEEGPGDGLR